MVGQCLVENLDVLTFAAGQVCDERARIRCYHRSFRNCFSVIENLTLPRSLRSCVYAVEAASSSRPRRTVAVTPSPVDFCALRSRSSEISKVILRLFDTVPIYQSRYHISIWHRGLVNHLFL